MSHKRRENNYLRALSEKHGLKFHTLYTRYFAKGLRGEELVARPASKGKFHVVKWQGKTYNEWQEWLSRHGRRLSYEAISGARTKRLREGMSEKEALHDYLKRHELFETYINSL